MRVLIDMSLSPRWVGALNDARMEPAHWSKLGHADASDNAVLTLARERNSVVLTTDLDPDAVLAGISKGKPSVVRICSNDLNPDAIGACVIAVLHQLAGELANGVLVTINTDQDCVRVLPLHS